MPKQYVVELTPGDRHELEALVRQGRSLARRIQHARILLKADSSPGAPGWTDERIAKTFDVGVRTVERIRQRLVEHGLKDELERRLRQHPPKPRKLDGAAEARLVALACSEPPAGRQRWTLRLLADQLVRLEIVDSIGPETVRRALKKNELKPWLKVEWCIAPQHNADFVCAMEQVLDLYHQPYDPTQPVVCLDETTKQLTAEVIEPLPPIPGAPARFDSLYRSNGVATIFMLFELLRGWRKVNVTEGKTRLDWAHQVRLLLEKHYPKAHCIHLVLDNLNTHKGASLYEAFEPAEAHRLLSRLRFHYTPKHGSWLNVAEIELSVLSRQCLDRRIAHAAQLRREIRAWERDRNHRAQKVRWQFTTENARIKLLRLYPSL